MSILQVALIAKSVYDCGFEHVTSETASGVTLASARHSAQIEVTLAGNAFNVRVLEGNTLLVSELRRHFPANNNQFVCDNSKYLRLLLRRAAGLAQSLPNQAKLDFESAVASKLKKLPDAIKGTEVEVMVRQRIGQQTFRAAMLDYWGEACAVTGIALPEVLRASHAKPWAACATDAERLDVFNGFLLSANLDALFDRFLITFDSEGRLLVSDSISKSDIESLGLNRPLRLRWLATEHACYLDYHRAMFNETASKAP
ncbi:HNH endonuclease [Thiohalocapsa marina]|uniref:HNH endonuclease n=1 Tax=Thiohalocapsa marina TaxID=424902 RepID=A0A5M8FCP0_9GAMM|nr:HNH endonuclease [Thiohalocapsa marina]KAA6182154.1 HNH endonuclease [Thiohalocapsa marina]